MSREAIKDEYHNVVGYYDYKPNGEIWVYDREYRLLGKAKENGTYDGQGNRIAMNKVPGLLLK